VFIVAFQPAHEGAGQRGFADPGAAREEHASPCLKMRPGGGLLPLPPDQIPPLILTQPHIPIIACPSGAHLENVVAFARSMANAPAGRRR
jgi:hypothetical protein